MKNYTNIKEFTALLIGSLIAISLFTLPALALAKDNDKGNGDEHSKSIGASVSFSKKSDATRPSDSDNDTEESENSQGNNNQGNAGDNNSGCFTAFGHLIAPGWIKHNGPLSISSACFSSLPPGIVRLFGEHGGIVTGTTTATTSTSTTLVLGGVVSTAGIHGAHISWNTSIPSNSTIFYSTSTPVNTASSTFATSSALVFNHFLILNNLSASTTYHFIVVSRDSSGDVATSSEASFTTLPAPVVNPLTISDAVAIVGTSTVKVNWLTNIAANSQVYYSTSTPVTIGASSTVAVLDSTLVTGHSLNVTGLATSTVYHFLIQSKDATNDISSTGEFSLTTGM